MQLELVSLTGSAYKEDVYEVVIPTAEGEISVFPTHMPLVTTAVPGVLSIRKKQGDSDAQLEPYAIAGGVVEIGGNRVRILVDEVEHGDEIFEEEARKALDRAKELASKASSTIELEKAQALMDRQAVRLKVAEIRRHRKQRP
jgi:F-type H+-transporting ATPase subunit epsilon